MKTVRVCTESAYRLIQSVTVSRNVRLFVPSWKLQFLVDWRLQVEELIVYDAKLENCFVLEDLDTFVCLNLFSR